MKNVWKVRFDDTTGEDNIYFKKLEENWHKIDVCCGVKPELHNLPDFIMNKKRQATNIFQWCVGEQIRDDYQESILLGLFIIEDESKLGSVKWTRPGAYHHARFMAHLLYGPKLLVFGYQLGYSQDFLAKLKGLSPSPRSITYPIGFKSPELRTVLVLT